MRGVCEKFTTIVRNPLRTNANYNLKSIFFSVSCHATGKLPCMRPVNPSVECQQNRADAV